MMVGDFGIVEMLKGEGKKLRDLWMGFGMWVVGGWLYCWLLLFLLFFLIFVFLSVGVGIEYCDDVFEI